MSWSRNEAIPWDYGGIRFRSQLEAAVAQELDNLGVNDWEYEKPVPDIRYLPDFTLDKRWADTDYQLPRWIEVKPHDLLYRVRDHFHVSERFTEDVTFSCQSSELRRDFGEIWKPKRLAEQYGEPVLVVSVLNLHQRLSIEMHPFQIVLSRSHPAVNWKKVLADRQKEQERLAWQDRSRLARISYLEKQARERAEFIEVARSKRVRPSKFDDFCRGCGRHDVPAEELVIFKDSAYWYAICRSHLKP